MLPVAALADIAAGRRRLTHGELDGLEQSAILAHLRSVLVATGTLPPRDEQIARLERFVSDVLATRSDPDQRQILRRYAVSDQRERKARPGLPSPTALPDWVLVDKYVTLALRHRFGRLGPPGSPGGTYPSGGCDRVVFFYGLIALR